MESIYAMTIFAFERAHLMYCPSVWWHRSFAMVFTCLISTKFAIYLNVSATNAGPLSDTMILGLLNIKQKYFTTILAAVSFKFGAIFVKSYEAVIMYLLPSF